ncbi:MAG TPA: hypothetical protein VFD49_09035 [Candidatus Dormibacteraeota bacterium]|nr:hypothetical protein [Candidatus Dormibacteraeota bacterium]
MSSVAPTKWAEDFASATNQDAELNVHGKFFTCTYLLDMGTRKVIVEMHRGKVENVNLDPQPLDAYQFALRAPEETWRGMAKEVPEPMYHGIWAASFRKGLRMEGDLLVLMQNLRCFTRQIELLRQTGVPV